MNENELIAYRKKMELYKIGNELEEVIVQKNYTNCADEEKQLIIINKKLCELSDSSGIYVELYYSEKTNKLYREGVQYEI